MKKPSLLAALLEGGDEFFNGRKAAGCTARQAVKDWKAEQERMKDPVYRKQRQLDRELAELKRLQDIQNKERDVRTLKGQLERMAFPPRPCDQPPPPPPPSPEEIREQEYQAAKAKYDQRMRWGAEQADPELKETLESQAGSEFREVLDRLGHM